ncbi:zinc knuckle CX2CX4HX4C containing protein [Tanacetum coccineum]
MGDFDNGNLDVYERKLCYDECENMYAEAVIFINTRLVRLIDVTVEQWLDLKYGDHTMVSNEVEESVIVTWLIQSYKKQFDEYMEIKKQKEVYGLDTGMKYDPSNVDFDEWLALKFSNYMIMDWYTKNAFWIYWTRGDDKEVITDNEPYNLGDENLIEQNKIAQIFRIDTDIFHFETPLCEAFKEFNYLLKIDVDVLTNDITGFKTYDEYKDAWIYEWNKDVQWVANMPCYEWYENLEEGELKDKALNSKVIFEESKGVDEEPRTNNDYETQKNEGWFDEHELMDDDDDDIDGDGGVGVKCDDEVSFCLLQSRMSNTSDKGTTFGDGAARVVMQLRSSPKVSTSSPLVSLSSIINVPRELYSIDVAATFGVPLTTVGDLQKLINDIDAGKHDELLSELTNEDRMETLEALGSICNSIKVDRNNADVIPCKVSYADDSINLNVDESTIPSDPIVQSVDINKSTSYAGVAGGSAKDQPNVNSNFRTLVADPVFDGVNISIPRKVVEKVSTRFEHTLYGYFIGKRMAFPVVEYYARNNWAKHGLKRIMMNSKGFFFFKFDSRAGLEAVLEGGPWLIRKSPIILKKWSMDTRLLKEELTRIPIWVKLHDVPIQVFEEDGISLIATFIGKPVMLDSYTSSMCNDSWGRSSFARCLIEVNSEADLVDVVTIGIPSLSEDDFTKETIRVEYEWRPPRCDTCKIFGHVHDYCPKKVVSPPIVATSNVVTPNAEKTNDGFQMVGKKKKRKGKSKSTNGDQFAGSSVKQTVRYEPKATTSVPKKRATNKGNESIPSSTSSSMLKTTGFSFKKGNITTSNSFFALNDDEEDEDEAVEIVYDESANLFPNTKAGENSFFMAATG